MKLHILFPIKDEPSGGGNQFLKALRTQFRSRGLYCEDAYSSDIIFFNSFPTGHAWRIYRQALDIKRRSSGRVRFVHRVDGPVSVVRGSASEFMMDKSIAEFNEILADATIYQTAWSAKLCEKIGIGRRHMSVVIGNAPDSGIFFPAPHLRQSESKIKVVASSWSSNWRKGFDVYRWIDANLDPSQFDFTFIGNSPFDFERFRHIPAVGSEDLAKLLRAHDVYLTASLDDPCSNAVLEALACGLPVAARRSGGHPEIVGSNGFFFDGVEDVVDAIENAFSLVGKVGSLTGVKSIDRIADEYVEFSEKVLDSAPLENNGFKVPASVKIKLALGVARQRWLKGAVRRVAAVAPVQGNSFMSAPAVLFREDSDAGDSGVLWRRHDAEMWVRKVWGRLPVFLDCLRHSSNPQLYRFSLSGDLATEPLLVSSVFAVKARYMRQIIDAKDRLSLSGHILGCQGGCGEILDHSIHRAKLCSSIFSRESPYAVEPRIVEQTRQSFAALAALGLAPERPFAEIPSDARQTQNFVTALNWERPWGAASHISHLVFFLTWHQRWFPDRAGGGVSAADVLADVEARYRQSDGSWHAPGAQVSPSNKVNGAMKMVSALDAVGQAQLSNPEGLIDLCLSVANNGHACNHFNVIFVLHRCIQLTEHRRAEVEQYLLTRLSLYRQHYWPWSGGFSFFPARANDRYYGARVSRGMPEPDIHGTVLMVWGIVLICEALGLCQDLYMQRPIT